MKEPGVGDGGQLLSAFPESTKKKNCSKWELKEFGSYVN